MSDDPRRIPLTRQAVRVLPLSPADEVLLLHCINPSVPDAPYWVSIGGGIEDGEDERDAAVRELWEETGIRSDPTSLRGPVHHEVVEFAWAEYDIVQHQRYYCAPVTDTGVTFAYMEQIEIDTTLGYRWWTLDELRATSEYVLPNVRAVAEASLGDRAYFRHGLPGW